MKTLGNILLAATALALLAAIWAPGAWWQWLATALILLIAGAGVSANAEKPRQPAPTVDHDVNITRSGRTYGRKADG